MAGESVSEWMQANGWGEAEDPKIKDTCERVWGTAPNRKPFTEEEVRELQGAFTWKSHVMSVWLDWWSLYHPDTPAGSWIAGVGTLHHAFKRIPRWFLLLLSPKHFLFPRV